MAEIIMYMRPTCPYCVRATQLLQSKGHNPLWHDLNQNPALRDQMIRLSGRTTVPQIFINGVHVGGCDDLMALNASGKLDKMLEQHAPQQKL